MFGIWQIGLRTIWEKYYEEAHAIMYVIDAACPSSFEDSKSAIGKPMIDDKFGVIVFYYRFWT